MEGQEGLILQGCGGDLQEWLDGINVPNQLGGFAREQTAKKPDCPLIGEDGNIFNLIGVASRTLRENDLHEQTEKMRERIMDGECHDYYAALRVIGEYVNITGKPKAGYI